ncbi:hypothetical protein J2X03_003644 [Microbacterium trichothecenolyticum]|uniref:hypothetical protein n=1 Tax=Microbacterium trichothecenolyticum TaxID=69370 RepID=UPI00285EDD85|nr:hypothetical protein [Microbacterium trichothecenolyticum]MDR7113744.1 hypothetical protein [Microbacterium trichothecenolyticum]
MGITIEDRAETLLELLWIREAYDLRPEAVDLPPALAVPLGRGRLDAPSAEARAEWTSGWPALWVAVVEHAGKEFDPAVHERLSQTTNGSTERLELLQEIVGPSWRGRYGPEALEQSAYREWSHATFQAKLASRPADLEGKALRRDLDAVVAAWRSGMTKIITIPCNGDYTRRVGDNALLMTEQTMTSSVSFRNALGAFA